MLMAGAGILISGCNEDTIVPAGVAPGNNNVAFVEVPDTFSIISKSLYIDTLNTSAKFSGLRLIKAIGTVVDPYFGKTNAGVYFQVLPINNDFIFSSKSFTMEDVELVIPFTRFAWGDTANPNPQKFTLYELTEDLSIDETYYSNQTKSVNRGNPLASITVDMKALLDSAKNTDTLPPVLRFKMPQSFIDRVVAATPIATPSDYLQSFKGFYIEPDTMQNTGNVLPYFFLDGTEDFGRTAVVFYYHEDDSPTEQKKAFFNFDRDNCAQFNWISRNYPSSVQNVFDKYQQTLTQSDPQLFLQNLPGAAIDLRIPNIKSLPDAIINKAEIVITLVGTGDAKADSTYWSPIRIDPWGVNADGSLYEIEDRNYSDLSSAISFIGGTKSETTINGQTVSQYRFNIPKEVQKAIKDKRDELHLRLIGAQGFPAAYRLVAGGETHSTYTVEMHIVYSKPQ